MPWELPAVPSLIVGLLLVLVFYASTHGCNYPWLVREELHGTFAVQLISYFLGFWVHSGCIPRPIRIHVPGLDPDWTRIGSGLDADWTRIGRGLEAD